MCKIMFRPLKLGLPNMKSIRKMEQCQMTSEVCSSLVQALCVRALVQSLLH